MQKYIGSFSLVSMDETSFALSGMFNKQEDLDKIKQMYIGFLYVLLSDYQNLPASSNVGKFQ